MNRGKYQRAHYASRRQIQIRYAIRTLIWFWACAALLHLIPPKAYAAKQRGVKNAAVKGKSVSAPVRKLGKPVERLLNKDRETSDAQPLEIREHVTHKAGGKENITGILNRFKLPQAEKTRWSRWLLANYGSQPLPKGREVHFYFSREAPKGIVKPAPELTAVELDLNDSTYLTWEKDGPAVLFQRLEKPYDVEVHTANLVIENSISEDLQKAGIQPSLLSQLTDIFTWDLDLHKDLNSGDSVKILYEKRTRKGKDPKSYLRVLAAELMNAGQKFTAIYFEKEKGKGGYYDLEGRSLARNFLRFPLEFASITSQFTDSRFHPILRKFRPHTGVDFAAQRGTPVRAVGDGMISLAGWNGRYGKTIDLQHDAQYMSRYAHLDRYAEGIRPGAEVKKGQVIGYVGSTGRSTGPHLHFELYKDQQYIDPLSVDFPAEDTIEPALQRVFDNQKRTYLVELSAAPQT